MTTLKITVEIVELPKTGWFVAKSTDLRGLYAHGATAAQVRRRLPALIRKLIEAEGHAVVQVRTHEDADTPKGQYPRTLRANALIAA